MGEPFLCLGGCGRRLRSKKARARRYGERCWRKRQQPTLRTAHPNSGQITGQTELALTDHQPTLWSL